MAHNNVPSKLRTEVLSSSGKYIAVLAMLVLSLGVVAAYDADYKEKYSKTYYFGDDLRIVSKTTWTYYDNEKRFSTRDYRHGYSYRASGDYFDRKYSDVFYKQEGRVFISSEGGGSRDYRDRYYDSRHRNYDSRDRYDGYHFDSGLRYQYEYVPHLRSYEGRECYVSPPRGKLFYIKC